MDTNFKINNPFAGNILKGFGVDLEKGRKAGSINPSHKYIRKEVNGGKVKYIYKDLETEEDWKNIHLGDKIVRVGKEDEIHEYAGRTGDETTNAVYIKDENGKYKELGSFDLHRFQKVEEEQEPEEVDYSKHSISDLASIIRRDWGAKINFAAKPYLSAMMSMSSISDNYGMDSGASIVAYFLGNATSWRGDVAKQVKKELNKRLKNAYK